MAFRFRIIPATTNKSLDTVNCIFSIGHGLSLASDLLGDRYLSKSHHTGVVRPPSELVMIIGLPPSKIATQLLVVPKSMPITFPISSGGSVAFVIVIFW